MQGLSFQTVPQRGTQSRALQRGTLQRNPIEVTQTLSQAKEDPIIPSKQGSGHSVKGETDSQYTHELNCRFYEHLNTIDQDMLKLYNKSNGQTYFSDIVNMYGYKLNVQEEPLLGHGLGFCHTMGPPRPLHCFS